MTWSTASAQLAAVYAGLGFIVSTRATEIIEKDNRLNLRFFISDTPAQGRWLHLERDWLRNAWDTGELFRADPLHPFLQGHRGIVCMKALLRWQDTGDRIRLIEVVPGRAWQYELGEEDPRLTLCTDVHRSIDLPLAAALGVTGIPVIDSDGAPPRRGYLLPAHGHRHLSSLIADPSSATETAHLMRRVERGRPDLQIEVEDPDHPLCAAYQATYAYGKLQAEIRRIIQRHQQRNVLLKAPNSKRRALIPENPTPALWDEVGRHFKIQS